MQLRKPAPVMLGAVAALSLFTGACATKKHVREAIAPVQTQVGELSKEQQSMKASVQQSIGDLDRNVARADEHAMEADRKAREAAESANRASSAASTAQQRADQAAQSAQMAMSRANTIAENLDNYQLLSTEKVYFRVNRSDLTREEREKLDQAVSQISNSPHFVIEVEGFTDKTGSKAANMELARRRADAVVRYLTVEKNIPLRRIHTMGIGSDFPDANNRTRAARRENRRVDIKVYALDVNGGQQGTQSSSNSMNDMNRQTPRSTPATTPATTPTSTPQHE